LENYNPELMVKDRLIAITKADLLDEVMIKQMKATLPKNFKSIFISSVSQMGLMELKDSIWTLLNDTDRL
ncbi:MAG: GTPase ObgE, partial [Bacteroidales bacterium]|nr:GTPase ObgE [Bacteroidales bacterium]